MFNAHVIVQIQCPDIGPCQRESLAKAESIFHVQAGASEHARTLGGKGSDCHHAAVIGDTVSLANPMASLTVWLLGWPFTAVQFVPCFVQTAC